MINILKVIHAGDDSNAKKQYMWTLYIASYMFMISLQARQIELYTIHLCKAPNERYTVLLAGLDGTLHIDVM